MWLDDLTYFLHEFGHAMQAILTTTDYGLASGWRWAQALHPLGITGGLLQPSAVLLCCTEHTVHA